MIRLHSQLNVWNIAESVGYDMTASFFHFIVKFLYVYFLFVIHWSCCVLLMLLLMLIKQLIVMSNRVYCTVFYSILFYVVVFVAQYYTMHNIHLHLHLYYVSHSIFLSYSIFSLWFSYSLVRTLKWFLVWQGNYIQHKANARSSRVQKDITNQALPV